MVAVSIKCQFTETFINRTFTTTTILVNYKAEPLCFFSFKIVFSEVFLLGKHISITNSLILCSPMQTHITSYSEKHVPVHECGTLAVSFQARGCSTHHITEFNRAPNLLNSTKFSDQIVYCLTTENMYNFINSLSDCR